MSDNYQADQPNMIEEEIQKVKMLCDKIGSIKLQAPNAYRANKKSRGRSNLSMDQDLCKLDSNKRFNKNKSTDDKYLKELSKGNSGSKKDTNSTADSKQQSPKKLTQNQVKSSVRVANMLNRFKANEETKKSKLQEIKRKNQEVESAYIKSIPEINERSKKLKAGDIDFLSRLDKYKLGSDAKKKDLYEKEMAKREAEEKKLLEEMNNKCSKKLDKKYIDQHINDMMEWSTHRKMKIDTLKEQENKKREEVCTFKPDINKNSSKMVSSRNNEVADRLYKQDVVTRKYKKEILEDIYVPSFVPALNNYVRTECNQNMEKSHYRTNSVNTDYVTNRENNVDDILKERFKILRSKNVDI